MKQLIVIITFILFNTNPVIAQHYHYGYDIPCAECARMAESLSLNRRDANGYYKVIHNYAHKIENVARRPGRDLAKADRRIYNLRADRDTRVQKYMSPRQFNSYVRITMNNPSRIHDKKQWFMAPSRPQGNRRSYYRYY